MNIDAVRQMHDYSRWAFERLWACIESLTEAQFTEPLDYSLGSIRNQMVHVIGVEDRWFARLSQRTVPPFPEADDFPTIAAVKAEWQRVSDANLAQLQHWNDADLAVEIVYDMPHRGGMKRDARWQILAHVLNHATDHRAQILAGLHRLGAPTIEQDAMFYFWESKGK